LKPKENISLIGFMGSGKTTIGKLVAERTGYLFIDLDRIIELSESKTINEIFACSGEEHFREIESKIIKKVYSNNKCVFACGGGVILRGENMKLIRRNSMVFYLEVSPREALSRLEGTSDRPLIQAPDKLKNATALLESRDSMYKKYSDTIIKNEGSFTETAVNEILKKFQNNK